MLRTFTLDTNCLIDVEEDRPAAKAIRKLVDAHTKELADVAVVAMSASERPKGGHRIRNFSEFESRLAALGLTQLNIILPMAYFNISFFDRCLLTDDTMSNLERQIHSILFPNEQFLWRDYCHDKGIDPSSDSYEEKWRNSKCDVQAVWSHIHSKRDVFVTRDKNFHRKKSDLIALGVGYVEYPNDALSLL